MLYNMFLCKKQFFLIYIMSLAFKRLLNKENKQMFITKKDIPKRQVSIEISFIL